MPEVPTLLNTLGLQITLLTLNIPKRLTRVLDMLDMLSDLPSRVLNSIGASSSRRKWTGLAFVHLFDLQICFVGVFPTRQDLNDNVN